MPSFYEQVSDRDREAGFEALLAHTLAKNGPDYTHRERWLATLDDHPVRHGRAIDAQQFAAGLERYKLFADAPLSAVALLGFVKVNAGEQYGVEVLTSRLRQGSSPYQQLEQLLMREEHYHSRILTGAVHQFGMDPPHHDYRPPLPLKLLIATLARAPRSAFHSIVLATEVGGVKAFTWLLQRMRSLFPDEPVLRETLEERLLSILVDEVSHIAFHRLCCGSAAAAAARQLSQPIIRATTAALEEMQAIGLNSAAVSSLDGFDYGDLPDEVKQRALFM